MNIYRFIQSKSVREHLEKINYIFSSLEMAYIIWQCPDATLAERFGAWKEIIDTMPDTPLPDSMELQEMEGVHEFLRQYIKLQQEFLDEFNGEEDGVYFYRYIVRELPNKTWPWQYITMENFDHAFLSLSECKRAIQEDIDYESPLLSGINFPVPPERCEEEEMVEIVVQRQMVSAYFEITAFLNERLEILAFDIPQKYLEPKGEKLLNAFKKMYFNIPVPFETGDIVYADMFYPNLMSREELCPVVFDSISGDEKSCFIYSVDSKSPTGNFFWNKIKNYLALEYYRGELNGLGRFLKTVSSFLKGRLDLEKLIQTWIVLSFDQMTAKVSEDPEENRLQLKYSVDGTDELTGLKTTKSKTNMININVQL